ncbi:hypothetical protein Atai01_05380 [Amycolatopsis taiwanensis]|uniref:Uncharacterized protein n=1 Tax=Amycolatopsis taiwanensis TaxID=342230 RepID=A0A9W6QTH3_9PSEU|nr:hypothetical protein Atai01_05380 [Amycolatopsis taiwanensis]
MQAIANMIATPGAPASTAPGLKLARRSRAETPRVNSSPRPKPSNSNNSNATSTARTRAPSSILREPRNHTSAIATTVHSHHGEFIPSSWESSPDILAPNRPYIANWTAL